MNAHGSQGFIKLIILIIIGLVVLGYFGLDIKEILASPVVEENLAYGWELAKKIWTTWLHEPVVWVIEHVVKFLWELLLNGIGNMRS